MIKIFEEKSGKYLAYCDKTNGVFTYAVLAALVSLNSYVAELIYSIASDLFNR